MKVIVLDARFGYSPPEGDVSGQTSIACMYHCVGI
jgi:hypothetical protein